MGVTYQIEANNALIYPGLGLFHIKGSPAHGPDDFPGSSPLGGIVDTTKTGAAILPPVSKITEFSERIAALCCRGEVIKQGLNCEPIADAKEAVDVRSAGSVHKEL